jgi:hypothetical protein
MRGWSSCWSERTSPCIRSWSARSLAATCAIVHRFCNCSRICQPPWWAEAEEVLSFIERHVLHGKGIGYVDVHLLASVALTVGAQLWTRDGRLQAVAEALGCAFQDTAAH